MNTVSFDVKFQSNSVNDGRVIAGRIYTTFLPVKYSHVVVTLFIIAEYAFYFTWPQLTSVSLDHIVSIHPVDSSATAVIVDHYLRYSGKSV